jgi:prepilin-type N-terminal cleavage/methylation domain-containing protein
MTPFPSRVTRRAFTLIELLVVIAVIGILAAIGVPALKGMGGTTSIAAATRQLMDDLSYARLKAINERTTVYVVFVGPTILNAPWTPEERREVSKHANLQYTSYALFTRRSLGDQPGTTTPRYITDWRTLPEGTLIPTNKFDMLKALDLNLRENETLVNRPFYYGNQGTDLIPFPTATGREIPLPFIAFDYQGRLKQPPSVALMHDVIVPISKGSVIYPQEDPNAPEGNLGAAEVIETPKGNYTNNPAIFIDWLTGRARVVNPEKIDYALKDPRK